MNHLILSDTCETLETSRLQVLLLTCKATKSDLCTEKTCSCPFVRYFGTLFWDDITIYWDKNYVQNSFFPQLKIITNFHPKIRSQNIVRKGHEQV